MKDTEKLELILEHAREYYENEREYHFVDGGFVCYELFDTAEGRSLYIADIFVSKAVRGGKAFGELIQFCLDLEHTEGVKIAFTRVEKQNPHLDVLQKMYKGIGFRQIHEDNIALFYRLDV